MKNLHPRTKLIGLLAAACLALACLAGLPQARAVCQEGCDLSNANTFLGDGALVNNTTGTDNTANGSNALYSNTTGRDNTATGSQALLSNTTGVNNTASGSQALLNNTTGDNNTATGTSALLFSTTGDSNTATGLSALAFNTTGSFNTATGSAALYSNTTGDNNTATGLSALSRNTIGVNNTATGFKALFNSTGDNNTATGSAALAGNTTGFDNTATGGDALSFNISGTNNVANGYQSLPNNRTGSSNIAVGSQAGQNLTTGSNNIYIGSAAVSTDEHAKIRIGTTGIQKATFIAGISGVTVPAGVGVIVGTDGKLGTVVSSERFKDEVKPMDKTSEVILTLKPVTFHYKHELDPVGIPQFGLVAEEVAKVDPNLVARDEQGKPYTVRYEAVNAMLLNEFLKEHRKVEEEAKINQTQEATIAAQQKEIKALTAALKAQAAQIQKVSDQLRTQPRVPRVVAND